MNYKIEEGYEIPPVGVKRRFPFEAMKKGDSFLVEISEHKSVYAAAIRYKKRNPVWDYAIRKVEEGYRVWRVK